MKFLADMGISLQTVAWLRNAGYEVVHLRDEGLQTLPDEEILIQARIEARILLTLDLDFGYLLAIAGESLPSVIIFRLGNENYNMINERLLVVLDRCGDDLETGAIISVKQLSFRVRKLPIS